MVAGAATPLPSAAGDAGRKVVVAGSVESVGGVSTARIVIGVQTACGPTQDPPRTSCHRDVLRASEGWRREDARGNSAFLGERSRYSGYTDAHSISDKQRGRGERVMAEERRLWVSETAIGWIVGRLQARGVNAVEPWLGDVEEVTQLKSHTRECDGRWRCWFSREK